MKDSGIEWIGEIPEEWGVEEIKYLFDIYSGTTPKSTDIDYWDGSIVWITPADFETKDVYISDSRKKITEEGRISCGLKITPPNSIIFSKRAPVGKVAVNTVPLCTNQGCFSCVPKQAIATKYFYYVMSSCTAEFELYSAGSTFKEISADLFKARKFPVPEAYARKRIVDYLDRKCAQIDAVIARQEAVIEKLKKYKLSLITEAVTRGLNPNAPMKDSGVEWIGQIPEHWKQMRLSDLCDRGITYGIVKLGEEDNDGVKVLRCSDVQPGYIDTEHIRTVTRELSAEYSRTVLHGGEIVINVRGTLGGCAIVPDNMKGYNIAREVAMVSVIKADSEYVMFNLLSDVFNSYQQYSLRGVIYVGLNINLLARYVMFLPPETEQKEIAKFLSCKCRNIDETLKEKQMIVERLTSYKKSLIYEVVTGKREIPA